MTTPEAVYLPVVIDEQTPDEIAGLIDRAGGLLDAIDAGYASLSTCKLASPENDPPLFVLARSVRRVMARPPEAGSLADVDVQKRPHAAVNRDHPHFRKLAELAEKNPPMAAYCLAKSLLLAGDRLLEADSKLMSAATEQ